MILCVLLGLLFGTGQGSTPTRVNRQQASLTTAGRNETWDVPCPGRGGPGACSWACFTPNLASTVINFDPPLSSNSRRQRFDGRCMVQCVQRQHRLAAHRLPVLWPLTVETKNVTATGAVLQIRRGCSGGTWGQALQVSWGSRAPPPPPPAPRKTPLSIMMFYGYNETAQCCWTTHAWQELGSGQAFKKNLSVALADIVSSKAHCGVPDFVIVPPAIWDGKTGLAKLRQIGECSVNEGKDDAVEGERVGRKGERKPATLVAVKTDDARPKKPKNLLVVEPTSGHPTPQPPPSPPPDRSGQGPKLERCIERCLTSDRGCRGCVRALAVFMVDGGASQGCVGTCVDTRSAKECRGCVKKLAPQKQHDEDTVAWSHESLNAADEEPEEWDEM